MMERMPKIKPIPSSVLLEREYSWEELCDIEQDISDAISDGRFPGEYTGRIVVKMVYEGTDLESDGLEEGMDEFGS